MPLKNLMEQKPVGERAGAGADGQVATRLARPPHG
jgi:hypothetical protein